MNRPSLENDSNNDNSSASQNCQSSQARNNSGPFYLVQSSLQCKAGCGFFGNPEWLGYCSICYKQLNSEYLQHRPQYFPNHPSTGPHQQHQYFQQQFPSPNQQQHYTTPAPHFTFNQIPPNYNNYNRTNLNSQRLPQYSVTQYRQQIVYPPPTILSQDYYARNANLYHEHQQYQQQYQQSNQLVKVTNPIVTAQDAQSSAHSSFASLSQPTTPTPAGSTISHHQLHRSSSRPHSGTVQRDTPSNETLNSSIIERANTCSDSNQTLASLDTTTTPHKERSSGGGTNNSSSSNILSNLTSPTSLVMMGYDTLTNLHNTILSTAKSSFRASPSSSADGVDSFSVHSTSQSEYQMRQKSDRKQVCIQ